MSTKIKLTVEQLKICVQWLDLIKDWQSLMQGWVGSEYNSPEELAFPKAGNKLADFETKNKDTLLLYLAKTPGVRKLPYSFNYIK